jgi:hypothetical protein
MANTKKGLKPTSQSGCDVKRILSIPDFVVMMLMQPR